MVPITRRHLPRRTFLKGAGAAIALPWLDAMCPALSRPGERPLRAVFVFAPNGMKMDEWRPATAGADFVLPRTLEPLAAVRAQVTVLSGLDLDAARAHGDGPGDHARACAAFLTCAHPRKTGGADLRAGISVDQVIAAERGGATRFASLELGMEGGAAAGICDSGYSCAYSNHVSWRKPSTPVAKETSPRALFVRLFGDPARARAEELRRRELESLLDAVAEDAGDLRARLSRADRSKLDDYLTAVRELEQRLAAPPPDPLAAPEGLLEARTYPQRLALMYEILALALQTDSARVATLMLGNAGSSLSYPWLGIRDGHHGLSHHRGDADKHAKIAQINRWQIAQLAVFLERLAATDDGGESLLARTALVYGSGIADGNRHDHGDLPILVAGGANGHLRGGRHVVCERGTPLANLYASVLGWLGIARERFGDSTGALAGL